jgi:hypothetical protein
VAAEEMNDTDPSGFDKIDAEKVERTLNNNECDIGIRDFIL